MIWAMEDRFINTLYCIQYAPDNLRPLRLLLLPPRMLHPPEFFTVSVICPCAHPVKFSVTKLLLVGFFAKTNKYACEKKILF
jgi:hypothetical protein